MKHLIKSENGHSTVTVIIFIMLIATIFISASLVVRNTIFEANKSIAKYTKMSEAEIIVQEIIEQFELDPTPDAHSLQDPVWEYISEKNNEALTIELNDISSRLNLNWMRIGLFEHTKLKNLIISGVHYDQILTIRNENGFVNNYDIWLETFGEENIQKYFTFYSWANINVTDEVSLQKIYESRYGENGSENFRVRIQDYLKDGKLWETDELKIALGIASDKVYPVINTLPQYNVHFLDPFLLECILSYPYRQNPINNHTTIKQSLIDIRENSEIEPDRLLSLINPEDDQRRVMEYLGTQTSFWELYIKSDNFEISYIISYDGDAWNIISSK